MSRTLLGLELTTPTVRLDDSSDNIHQQQFYGHYTGQPALVSTSGTIYFTSVAVAVDSSHMTVLSSASQSRFSQPSNFVNGHVLTMWFMVCRWPHLQLNAATKSSSA